MADFLNEIKDDLKQERLENIIRKYGKYLIVLAIFVIGATAAIAWYNDHLLTAQEEAGSKYFQALKLLDKEDAAGKVALDELAIGGSSGYREFAKLKRASLLAKDKNIAEAIAVYDKIIADTKIDLAIRDLAGLLAAHLLMENPNPANNVANNIDDRLAVLAKSDRPLYYSAIELQVIRAIQKDDKAKAAELLVSLNYAPQNIRERADKLANIINR